MDYVSLAHGNGGRLMRRLIEETFARILGDRLLECRLDATPLPPLPEGEELVVSTDGFTVQPLEFPGGDIGALAVHGTVNDLAVAGATPHHLTLNAFIEEGLPMATLERVIGSFARAATEAGVTVAAGDTKVVPRGQGSGLYLATAGIGTRPVSVKLDPLSLKVGDQVLVSGPVGDHGISVLLAREEFGLSGDLQSDAATVLPLTLALREMEGVRFMRDPTRGGLATVMHELQAMTGLGLRLQESALPVRDPVRGVCEILGYDPLFLACEGRVVAVVDKAVAEQALALWHGLPLGAEAAIVGEVVEKPASVVLQTELGGERILQELEDDPLPRIC